MVRSRQRCAGSGRHRLRHARRHREVVERFERFPHRNAILRRTSTAEEATFLQQSDDL